jgi:hypothetical protein
MARGRTKKTEIKASEQKIVKQEFITPEMVEQSFGSDEGLYGFPSRLYQNSIPQHDPYFSYMRYRFGNLYQGIMPFQQQQGYISVRDAVWLCQKAYFNVAVFRNAINTLAELCNTEVYLEGGNQQSQDFFTAWFKRICLWKLKDEFFRELFRSGNIFLFRLDGDITRADALKMNQTYGANGGFSLPLRYIMLNVADIAALNNITYDTPAYFKILTPQQVQILKKSTNSDDKEVYKSLSKAISKYFESPAGKFTTGSPIPIDLSKLHTIFYQKQDYEPFAVPMGFAVLDDINLKLEFKKTDAVLARTVEYITLLITTGSEMKPDGSGGVSQKSISALQQLFSREQIGRVLVADYTTKMDWSIPDLSKALGPQKYQVVNEDIAQGLMDIFFGQQRFANVVAKLKVFVEKLNRVQEIFINDFLQPEIKRVAELMNFKSFPTARFIKVDLDDPNQTMRIIAQLIQLGVLTAKDGIEAMETGEFPEFSRLVENQTEYKQLKDKGLFQPIIAAYPPEQVAAAQAMYPKPAPAGAGQSKPAQLTGRPPGAKAPQTTKKVSPIGTTSGEQKFSMTKLIDSIKLMDKVRDQMTASYKKAHKIKRVKDSDQELIEQLSKTLFENESVANWEDKVEEYTKNPVPPDFQRVAEIAEIANEFEVSDDAAILLYHSKI